MGSESKPFVWVIVPVWNCERWLDRNFSMLSSQIYKDHAVHIVDDASTDATPEIIKAWVDKNDNWTWHRNISNQKCPRNIWEAFKRISPQPNDVIFLLDGDDYLPNRRVLSRIATVFQDEYLWLTYGQYLSDPENNGQIPARDYEGKVYHKRRFRQSRLQLFNHPLVFRAHLWNALEERDLQDDNGNWFTIGYDKVIMLPMLEMATPDDGGSRHWRVLDEVLYMYNAINPESDCFKKVSDHTEVDKIWDRPVKRAHYI